MVTDRQLYGGIAVAIIAWQTVGVIAYLDVYFSPHIPGFIGWRGVLVSDVQFEEGYLNVTITNYDNLDYIVNEVIVSQSYPRIFWWDEIVNKPISGYEKISICINLNWTSRYEYGIRLKTTGGDIGTVHVRAP